MRYIISLIVENKHGVLAKIAQVITGRGYNINTLSVGPSFSKDTSRMILTFDCDEKVISQITKQINKLVDVISLSLIEEDERVERELVVMRIERDQEKTDLLHNLINIYGANIVDVSLKYLVIELTSHSQKINTFIEDLRQYKIHDLMRTGPLALPKFDD